MAKLFIIIRTSLYHSELKHVSSFVLPPSLILSLLLSLSHRFIDDDPKRSLKLLLLSSEAKSSSWIIKYFLPNSCQGNSGLLFQIIVIHPQSEFILFHLISQHFPVSLALFLSLFPPFLCPQKIQEPQQATHWQQQLHQLTRTRKHQ